MSEQEYDRSEQIRDLRQALIALKELKKSEAHYAVLNDIEKADEGLNDVLSWYASGSFKRIMHG